MPERRPFVGGNWKMNTHASSAAALAQQVASGVGIDSGAEVAIFPPFVYLDRVGAALTKTGSHVALGAQNCFHEPDGAYTGEISLTMLKDIGVKTVLTGHSERRHALGESDELVGSKTAAVVNAGLLCLLCVGEQLEERKAGATDAVNERQLRAGLADVSAGSMEQLVIAYEPVWAIGTGLTATPQDAQAAHAQIRVVLEDLYDVSIASRVRVLYGGSVKPGNAGELFSAPDIDGGLIGGASLNAADFLAIVAAAGS